MTTTEQPLRVQYLPDGDVRIDGMRYTAVEAEEQRLFIRVAQDCIRRKLSPEAIAFKHHWPTAPLKSAVRRGIAVDHLQYDD